MGGRFHSGAVRAGGICLLLMFAANGVDAQSDSAQSGSSAAKGAAPSARQPQSADPKPCSVIPDPNPCGPKPAASGAPSAIDRFPFPGSADSSSGPAPGIGGPAEVPQSPATGTQSPASPADTTKKFPYPGAAAAPGAPSGAPIFPTPEAGSSSSSSSDSDPADALPGDAPDLKDTGSDGTQSRSGAHILHRAAPRIKTETPDEREAEDLDVAKFYMDSGDLKGAYLRMQDAVKTAPDDPEAHFTLAELAVKLGRKEEAIAEYNACLRLDPTDKQKKDSSKALARLAK